MLEPEETWVATYGSTRISIVKRRGGWAVVCRDPTYDRSGYASLEEAARAAARWRRRRLLVGLLSWFAVALALVALGVLLVEFRA